MIRSIGCGKTIGHSGGLHGPGVELVLAGSGGVRAAGGVPRGVAPSIHP